MDNLTGNSWQVFQLLRNCSSVCMVLYNIHSLKIPQDGFIIKILSHKGTFEDAFQDCRES